MTKNTYYFR